MLISHCNYVSYGIVDSAILKYVTELNGIQFRIRLELNFVIQ